MQHPDSQTPLTPGTIARQFVDTVRAIASADDITPTLRMQALNVIDLSLQAPRLTFNVVEAVLDAIDPNTPGGAAVAKHRADPVWSRSYPLGLQAYSPVLGSDPLLHLSLVGTIAQSAWPREAAKALREGMASGVAAKGQALALCTTFDAIGSEAITMVEDLGAIRHLKSTTGLHVVQAETVLAIGRHKSRLTGTRCIDLGTGDAAFASFLRNAGAVADSTELVENADTLFGVPVATRYDLVTATALMEPGAFVWPQVGLNVLEYAQRYDELITTAAALLAPGGLLVVRNLNHPLPFSPHAIAQSKLVYLPTQLPLCMPNFGGRLAVWRKQ